MSYRAILNIRAALQQMEADLGLSAFSETERLIVYSALSLIDENGKLMAEKLRSRVPASSLPHATYHRLLNKLISSGAFTIISSGSKREFSLNISSAMKAPS